jgi:predicted enzyme related to lactoylglutathione lyase
MRRAALCTPTRPRVSAVKVQRAGRSRRATLVDDQRQPDGTGWAVMQDPEGNEFCLLRSAAEMTS